jgi:hypothetical protein
VKNNLFKDADEIRKVKLREMKETCVTALRSTTPVDTGEARDGWRVDGDKIVNEVEHISLLNEGASEQAPEHFVERTLLSVRGVKPNGTIVRSI